jgi:hypothetical protein
VIGYQNEPRLVKLIRIDEDENMIMNNCTCQCFSQAVEVVAQTPQTPDPIRNAIEVGLIVFVIVLVVIAIIIGISKVKKSEEDNDDDDDGQHYY